jgi:hypothetical protein
MAKEPTKRGAKKEPPVEEHHVHLEDVNNLSEEAANMLAPTEANIREIRHRIEAAFNALGTDRLPGTIIPAGKGNNAAEAAEFVIADMLAKLATTRLKKATEAAEKVGVFGHSTDYVTGDTVMVFSDPNFSINVKMGKPSKMINREQVEARASEFLGRRATEFLDGCFKPRAATKQIIVSIK